MPSGRLSKGQMMSALLLLSACSSWVVHADESSGAGWEEGTQETLRRRHSNAQQQGDSARVGPRGGFHAPWHLSRSTMGTVGSGSARSMPS